MFCMINCVLPIRETNYSPQFYVTLISIHLMIVIKNLVLWTAVLFYIILLRYFIYSHKYYYVSLHLQIISVPE